MLDHITPVLLTYNEEANIRRTLSHLTWAKDIVVVDSGSTDKTLAIVANCAQVRVFNRPFDTHGNQWRYAVQETAITTPWVLRLDADYQLTDALIAELACLDPDAPVSAYQIAFEYAIFSNKLLSSLYPPNTILLRKGQFSVWDKGHTEAWTVEGPIAKLNSRIIHDDWKPTEQWMNAQGRYMRRELGILQTKRNKLTGWLRLQTPFMPIAVFLYCLFAKGLVLNGRSGMFYALQRLIAEATLSLMVLEQQLREKSRMRSDRSENSN
jgi:glycosyltransferase involved in cell wall biosynthesis